MASEGAKSPPAQPAPPQPAQAIAPYLPPYGTHYAPIPPGAYPPPFYAFAPIPDPNHDPNAPNAAPPQQYIMAIPPPPPGMVYAYAPPPPGQGEPMSYDGSSAPVDPLSAFPYPPYAAPPQVPTVAPRPKRKQVKMAVSVPNLSEPC